MFNKIINIIINKFRTFISSIDINKYNGLYQDIEVGDIVIAKRYTSKKERGKIPLGHQQGPFIVASKMDNELICYYGSGVKKKDFKFYSPDKDKYCFRKQTYFYLDNTRIINQFNLIKKQCKLSNEDKITFFQKIKENNSNYVVKNNEISYFDPFFKEGDIIQKDNYVYLILDIKQNEILALKTKSFRKGDKVVSDDLKTLNYSNVEKLNYDYSLQYKTSINNYLLFYVLNQYKEFLETQKNSNVTKRGSIIKINDRFYYVYGEEGQNWLVFKIYKRKNSERIKIKIQRQNFYTTFEESKILKNIEMENILLGSNEDIQRIKEQRFEYKQNLKENLPAIGYNTEDDILKLKPGAIVQLIDGFEEFIVTGIIGDNISCMSLLEVSHRKKSKIQYFNKNDLVVVKGKVKQKKKK